MKLRTRMFIAFLLVSFVPMILMSILSYNKARLMLVMNPEDVIQSLFHLTAFLLIAALVVAVILSYLVSSSIIVPVKGMERAMAKVRKGDLTTSPKVSANDELGVLAESFAQMIEGLRDRERIKETFGRFVTPEIAEAILEHPPVLGGENTEVSILFSDIRNYTTICEQLSPEAVISLLNDYFSYMVRAIEQHHGLVYQFVGDGIMAVLRSAGQADGSCQLFRPKRPRHDGCPGSFQHRGSCRPSPHQNRHRHQHRSCGGRYYRDGASAWNTGWWAIR